MHRHYVTTETLARDRIELSHAESRHFAGVLRLREGDHVQLFDGRGAVAECAIASVVRGAVTLERVGEATVHPRPRCRLTLAACISKGARMDWTIEKAVELGASAILPVASERSVVRIAPGEEEEKRGRWVRVAIDAARQCDAVWLPEIAPPLPFPDALARISAEGPVIAGALQPDAVPLRDALAKMRRSPAPAAAAWCVGPEGDFSHAEYDALRAAGAIFVSLGDLVLRTETAAMYGLCVLGSEWL